MLTGKKIYSLLLLIITAQLVTAQSYPIINGISRDTSFNPTSAYKKAKKQYPFIKLVKPDLSENVKDLFNVTYKELNERELTLDLFIPGSNTGKPKPVVLLIHGGGWASGSKEHMLPMAQKLAEKGFVTAAVEYRLSPEAKYPAGIKDLKAAIKWLKASASTYDIDTSKIAVLGGSAGATLASILGTTAGIRKFEHTDYLSEYSSKVHAVINMDGILDFTHPAESGKDTIPGKLSAGARWFGATYKESPEIWEEASPLFYVDENTSPVLFINSTLKRFHAGRDLFVNQLDSLGIFSEMHTIPGTPHPFWLFDPWFEKAFDYTHRFLKNVFEL